MFLYLGVVIYILVYVKKGLTSVSGNVIIDRLRHNKLTTCAHFLNPGSMSITLEVRNR